ncbi:MAG: uroporphyrinogen decarboxylase family protein [Armatimonadota bacterium]
MSTKSAMQPGGIHALLPREQMTATARKLRDTYAITPGAPIFQHEDFYYCLERWHEQGLAPDANFAELFGYDTGGEFNIYELGICEATFYPTFESVVLEDRGDYEVVLDWAGRSVLYFKGRRDGFMPEYLDHPVKDMASWEEKCRWRMDPKTPARWEGLETRMTQTIAAAREGQMIKQNLVGGYMYLRSLIGPLDLLYAMYDMPEVIHACMEAWLTLADGVIARHQEYVSLDVLHFGEDICYNHGLLCSPEFVKEYLFPYYQQLIQNVRGRQLDPQRHLYIDIDTDGNCVPAIPLYQEGVGMEAMCPFEVASGCDVVEIGRQFPQLVISGGMDKRVMAESKAAIDRMVERILPAMRARGGYLPTCDHGVPEEVPLDNYLHYRQRCLEFSR